MGAEPMTFSEKLEGFRKIIASVIVLVVGLSVTYFKGDIPANLLQLLQVIFAGFMAGNIGEHLTDALSAGHDAKVEIAHMEASTNLAETTVSEQVAEHDDKAQKALADIKASLVETFNFEQGRSEAISATLASIQATLAKATEAGSAPTFDYATAVQSMMKSLDQISTAQQVNSKALALIISRTDL